MNNITEVMEAILFASGTPKTRQELLSAFDGRITKKEFDIAIEELQNKYSGNNGILLLSFNNKIQMSTNPIYGDLVAEILTPLKEKELSKVLLEVLAIIAYKQPITRLEIENIKSTSPEYAISILSKVNLIEVVGHKNAVGRPALYGTTDEFLKKFQLGDISELPDYESVLARLEELGEFYRPQVELYRDIEPQDWAVSDITSNEDSAKSDLDRANEISKQFDDESIINDFMNNDELPEFLDGESYEVIE